jgi:hypothetical protein
MEQNQKQQAAPRHVSYPEPGLRSKIGQSAHANRYIKSARICQSMVRKLKYVRQVGGFGLLERARGANLEFNQ